MERILKFNTKKAAKESGYLARDQWFKKYRVPYHGEAGVEFRGEEYFRESQTEELFSRSKGLKEIGVLKLGAGSVGVKRFRTVRFQVYRESDFVFEEKIVRKIPPARTIGLIDAIAKITDTAAKFTAASKESAKRKNYKRSRGFRSRARKLLEVAEIGIRRAIVLEIVTHIGKRGGIHRYVAEGREFRSRVSPPQWFETTLAVVREPKAKFVSSGRLMDAIHTLEPFKDDPTLDW